MNSLAYTKESPFVPSRLTEHSKTMEQKYIRLEAMYILP